MDLNAFNQLNDDDALVLLAECCGSGRWVELMSGHRPFESLEELQYAALRVWYDRCHRQDWIEAFGHHPKIGDLESLEKRFGQSAAMAGAEQGQVRAAPKEVLQELADCNAAYELQFGYIFIVCATGKSAEEMLALIKHRLTNHPDDEIGVAMGEQAKITALRLGKQFDHSVRTVMGRSQITTHILDTSKGSPAAGVNVALMALHDDRWLVLTQGVTDSDGRIEDLLPPGQTVQPGLYKLVFDTGSYFERTQRPAFYPSVEIQFALTDNKHYHVPLLLNPFGYSTYRGS